jgi:hypothetical protein
LSQTLLSAVEQSGEGDVNVPVSIHSTIMLLILDWCEYHSHPDKSQVEDFDLSASGSQSFIMADRSVQHDSPEKNQAFKLSSDWDKAFFDRIWADRKLNLLDLAVAASYLGIEKLMQDSARIIARELKDKTPRQVCSSFHFEPGFQEADWKVLEEKKFSGP